MVLEDAVDPFEQAVVRLQERVARPQPTALGHDRLVFELTQLRDLELDELARCGLDLVQPTLVQLVPMLVVVAAPPREQLRSAGEGRIVGHQVRAQVDVAVEEPALGPSEAGTTKRREFAWLSATTAYSNTNESNG